MSYLYIVIISILIVSALMAVLLANSKTSINFHLVDNKLTILHPFKKEVINLDTELNSWNYQKINTLWRGKFYSINLKLNSGKLTKVYSRSRSGNMEMLINYLETTAVDKES